MTVDPEVEQAAIDGHRRSGGPGATRLPSTKHSPRFAMRPRPTRI